MGLNAIAFSRRRHLAPRPPALRPLGSQSLVPEAPPDANQADERSVSPSVGVSQGPSPGETKLGPKAKRNEERAVSEAAGARLVFTASADIAPGTNPRTCLLRAILPFTQPRERDLLVADVVASMPAEGDTSIKDISSPLAKHRIRLQRVSGAYLRKGGAPFHLFNRRECKLVVAVRLINREGRAWTHFVAWDGRTIMTGPILSR